MSLMWKVPYRVVTWPAGSLFVIDGKSYGMPHRGHAMYPNSSYEGEPCSICGRVGEHSVYRIDGEYVDRKEIDEDPR